MPLAGFSLTAPYPYALRTADRSVPPRRIGVRNTPRLAEQATCLLFLSYPQKRLIGFFANKDNQVRAILVLQGTQLLERTQLLRLPCHYDTLSTYLRRA